MISDKVRTILTDYSSMDHWPDTSVLATVDTSLDIGLGLGHADLLDVVIELEGQFPISIPDQATLSWATVGDVCKYVEQHVSAV